jgi:hypothetical protein
MEWQRSLYLFSGELAQPTFNQRQRVLFFYGAGQGIRLKTIKTDKNIGFTVIY